MNTELLKTVNQLLEVESEISELKMKLNVLQIKKGEALSELRFLSGCEEND